jgi:hypothetical protein
MRNNREYQICKDIAYYMRLQYPDIIYRFDMAGLNLSMAQAGMNKAIQCGKGWPDLFIAEKRRPYSGFFLELKAEGVKLQNKDLSYATPHLKEQYEMLYRLRLKGYWSDFAVGFDEAKKKIDYYLKKIWSIKTF